MNELMQLRDDKTLYYFFFFCLNLSSLSLLYIIRITNKHVRKEEGQIKICELIYYTIIKEFRFKEKKEEFFFSHSSESKILSSTKTKKKMSNIYQGLSRMSNNIKVN